MKLHKIMDLVGSTGIKVDIRTRTKTGELMYNENISGHHPVVTNLKSVEIRYQKISHRDPEKSKWLYWTWNTNTIQGTDYNCGYSGVASEFDNYYLQEIL